MDFTAGASVWAIANALLLSWIPINEAAYGLDDEEAVFEVARYMAWMALLVVLQTPAAGVLTTLYLGQAVFEHRPTWTSVFAEAKRQFWRWFWVLGVLRFAIPTMILVGLRWGEPASVGWDIIVPIAILLIAAIVRSSRPFMPEILLLEQCPFSGDSETTITMARRSKSLHTPMSSDLSGRFLSVSFVLLALTLSVFYTLMWFRGIAFGQWAFMDVFVLLVLYPLALWTVAGVSVLVRLLSYHDTRIRLEGWEVELAIRAEAMRQFGEESGMIGLPQEQAEVSTGGSQSTRQEVPTPPISAHLRRRIDDSYPATRRTLECCQIGPHRRRPMNDPYWASLQYSVRVVDFGRIRRGSGARACCTASTRLK